MSLPPTSKRPMGFGGHADDGAPAQAATEVRAAAQIPPEGDCAPVQPTGETRKTRPGWKAAADEGARVLALTVGAVRGAAASWAARLGVDPKISARFIHEGGKSPHLADLLMLPRDVRVAVWKALLVRDLDGAMTAETLDRLHLRAEIECSDPARILLAMDADGVRTPDELRRYAHEAREASEIRLRAAEIAEREADRKAGGTHGR
jgi:hypothetical protein